MRAALIGDVHLTDKPPSIRKATYAEEILAKLEFIVQQAVDNSVDAIVMAGDVFHIKTPSRTSHRLVQATHKVLTAGDIPVLIVPGNHDLQHDRIESLDSQPLGALGRMEGIEILIGCHESLPVFGLPYQQNWTGLPAILEGEYKPWADRIRLVEDQWPLLVTHAPIFPPGDEPIYDYIASEDWADLMQAGSCYYGHIHDPHGAYELLGGLVTMCNNGAISRGSLHAETLKRQPKFTLYDSTKNGLEKFEAVDIPVKPVEEVFSLALKATEDGTQQRLTEFLEGLGESTVEAQSVEQVSDHIRELDVDDKVRERAVELVAWAMGEK